MTTSGSGLDPHISPAAADASPASRGAVATRAHSRAVRDDGASSIRASWESQRVNVLRLNLALIRFLVDGAS